MTGMMTGTRRGRFEGPQTPGPDNSAGPGSKPGGQDPRGCPPGVTLVELLVVVLVSVIVMAVAFTLFRVNLTYYVKEDARLEQDQNLRLAMAAVTRDLRMAGNGYALLGPSGRLQFIQAHVPSRERLNSGQWEIDPTSGWFFHADEAGEPDFQGIRAVFGVDGGKNGPDTLSIFRAEVEAGAPVGTLASDFNFDNYNLSLAEAFPDDALESGDIVALASGDQAALAEIDGLISDRSVRINYGGRFTPPVYTGLASSFPAGTSVFNLRDVVFVTYYLADAEKPDEPCRAPRRPCNLMADYHELDPDTGQHLRVPVASNIEDFQVYYFIDDDGAKPPTKSEVNPADFVKNPQYMTSKALDIREESKRRVKAVGVGLVARSPRPEANARPQNRGAFFNRDSGAVLKEEPDRFTRSVMTEIVRLRNY